MSSDAIKQATRVPVTLALLTATAMLAFAVNSLLARLAFKTTPIDAATFTAIRLVAGALTLLCIVRVQGATLAFTRTGWLSAALLFIYAAAFSFAYRDISTGAGALVLFSAAQLTMISYGLIKGERASAWGMLVACVGMAMFLAPSASTPPLFAAMLMAAAGFAWGVFSLLGRTGGVPMATTATSFVCAVPFAAVLLLVQANQLHFDATGALWALLSGCVTSALGYAIWYWVRVRLTAISAGAVQLSVPVISAVLGVFLLGETLTLRSALCGLTVLGGIAWVTLTARR
ncbi:MAG: DMT family transporter [Pseudomonadota bacterium]|nr:DMT family transporter [Pseudomonadota bacterium]